MDGPQRGPMVFWGVLLAAGAAVGGWFLTRPRYVDDVPPPPVEVVVAPGTHALLVGCTDYPYLLEECRADARGEATYQGRIRLVGPAPDVELMARTLHAYLGVPEANIQKLVGWPDDPAARPTRDNILGALDALAQRVQPGERVVFHFGGHGSQQPDLEGDELDDFDEILLPADVRGWTGALEELPNAISDDEVYGRLRAIADRGASVFAVFDCCHAGSLSRDPTVRLRQAPPEVLGRTTPLPTPARRAAAGPVERDMSGIAAFYAVSSFQLAPEMRLPLDTRAPDRTQHGLFTWHLARTIQRFGGGLSFGELARQVADAYRVMPYDSVRPSAEGDLDLLVAREGAAAGLRLHARRGADGWTLDGGRLQGAGPTAVLEVWEPGAVAEGQALGRLVVSEAGPLTATCRALGTVALPTGAPEDRAWPVTILRAALPDVRLPLSVLGVDGRLATEVPMDVARTLGDADLGERFPLVDALEDAVWTLRPHRDGWALQRREVGLGPALEVPAGGLRASLLRLAKVQELLDLTRPVVAAPLPGRLQADLFWYPERPAQDAPEEGEPHAQDRATCPGDGLRMRLRNRTGDPVEVFVLGVDAAQAIDLLYPNKRLEQQARLEWDETGEVWSAPWAVADVGAGVEYLIVLVVPRHGDEGAATQIDDLLQEGFAQARGGPAAERVLCAKVFSWRTSYDGLGLPLALRDRATAVDRERVDMDDVSRTAVDGPPAEAFVGTHMLHLPGDLAGSSPSRAALWMTFDDEVLQVHLGLDPEGLLARGPEEAILAAAAEGTLGGDVVLRITPTERVTWYGTGDGREVVQQVPRNRGAPSWRHERSAAGPWERHPSLRAWLSMADVTKRGRKAVLAALGPLRLR